MSAGASTSWNRVGAEPFRQEPPPGMVKSEPMALATGLGFVGNHRLRPEASAFGSR